MRKMLIFIIAVACAVLFYFTIVSAYKVFNSSWELPRTPIQNKEKYRLVLITQELETPFWKQVHSGALEEAQNIGLSIEVWGSYGKNQEDFLKKIEIAIDSKVDGTIVQGLDTEEFKSLIKFKAAFYGIPIITVANDVPKAESLRKTYVGSDQFLAGQMIARQLLSDMGTVGTVILIGDVRQEYYQKQRLKGIQDVLKENPGIMLEYAETPDTRERVIATTQDILNRLPHVNAFIAVNANMTGGMVQEISRRSQVETYHIYSFDDAPETLSLLKQGKLDGMIEQSPEEMGRISVNLMNDWLSGETVPLDMDGYLTDIRMLKARDVR